MGQVTPVAHDVLRKPEQSEPAPIPPQLEFRDPEAAAKNLVEVRERVGPETYESLLNILGDSPDSDAALLLLGRLLDAITAGENRELADNPNLLHHLCLLFAHSAWLGETLLQNHDLLRRIANAGELRRSLSREEFLAEFAHFRARLIGADVALVLARFRKREYVRIVLRDVLGIAGLAEITEEISALADALLEEALAAANAGLLRRYGSPRSVDARGIEQHVRCSVVSLGKLGGNELNYSSDVDLVFLYDSGTELPTARMTNREYFIELAQIVTDLLSRRTREGQVFRIDLRLRPRGHEGELAVSLPRAIQYYSEVAHDWELQAMIKARHSAGDASLTRDFVRAIAPFVYRPNVNFAAVKTALQSRERIDKRGRRKPLSEAAGGGINVKLDRGGIRDIEFLAQCLQRVYGGEESWLRSRGTLFALQKLHDKEHISGKDFHHLTKAYEFLRNLEHHLQLRQGLQSHHLPAGEAELKVLARCVNRGGSAGATPEEFVLQVQHRMAAVAEIYRRIVYREQSSQFIDGEGNLRLLPEVSATAEDSYSQVMQRLAMDAPELLANIRRAALSQHARRNLDRFLASASTSSERYAAVLRSADAIGTAFEIFESSEFLSELLIRHPADLELLLEVREQAQASAGELFTQTQASPPELQDPVMAYLARSPIDRREAQSLFRQRYRQAVLLANGRDLARRHGTWELLRENSCAAENALAYALAIAGAPAGLAVVAVGRLGSREFDLLSDADVVFVADEADDPEECRRAAERVIEFLTAYTREGSVFLVDPRLRPRGSEGELVTTPPKLAQYFSHEAKPWEALTYLRFRGVAGNPDVAQRALEVVRSGSTTMALRSGFAGELREMRARLEASDAAPNFKTGPGGTYDIDFLAGRLQLQHGLWCSGNLADRVQSIRSHGWLEPEDATELAGNSEFLRRMEHTVRLVTGRNHKWLPVGEHAREITAKLMGFVAEPSATMEDSLTKVLRRTREIYTNYGF